MAILKKHISPIHDIHAYGQSWSFDPRSEGIPSLFNAQCQGAHLDWSGVSLRNRSYCRVIPVAFRIGFSEPFVESDINFWNTCNPCAVLISPRHALICQHYRGTHARENEYYTFLGRKGQKHERKVVAAYLSVGSDHTLLEFESDFPSDVKYYDQIADAAYVPANYDFWIHDCNGKCYKMSFGTSIKDAYGDVSSFSYYPIKDGVNDGITSNGFPAIHVGDSGSPCFAVDKMGKTILIGLMHGGMQINKKEIDAINIIMTNSGFSISHVKISAKIEDINQDGTVDGSDLAILMSSWGDGKMLADLNVDGKIDSSDMAMILNSWGKYAMLENVISNLATSSSSSDDANVKPRA